MEIISCEIPQFNGGFAGDVNWQLYCHCCFLLIERFKPVSCCHDGSFCIEMEIVSLNGPIRWSFALLGRTKVQKL